MPKQDDCRPKLSFEQANRICREFLPIGDQLFDYIEQLRQAGFAAFLPRYKFIESFSNVPEELGIHRQCVAEKAKEQLGRPWPMRAYDHDLKHLYLSPFLQQLREQRDHTNGVPVHELRSQFPGESAWRREVDPCLRRLIQAEMNDKETFEAQWTAMLEEERRALEEEAAQHATKLAKTHTFDHRGRYLFFSAVMARDAASVGFRYDKSKSRSNYPIFSKTITSGWDLCWAIEEARSFFHSPFEGRYEPHLELRSRNLRGRLAKVQSGEFLHIRYAGVLPGFFNGYWTFFDLDELEASIKAHLYLYGLMASVIEDGIRKVLGSVPG